MNEIHAVDSDMSLTSSALCNDMQVPAVHEYKLGVTLAYMKL